MLSVREAMAALYGTLRLVRLKADGLAWFDASTGGFWRSFGAAALMAPLYLISLALWPGTPAVPPPDPLRALLLQSIAYVMDWVAYPLVMVSVLRWIDRERHLFRYLVAYNWFKVPKELLFFTLAALYAAGVLPERSAEFLSLVAFGATLYYVWFIAKSALETDGYTAAGLVLIDLTVSLLISGIAMRA